MSNSNFYLFISFVLVLATSVASHGGRKEEEFFHHDSGEVNYCAVHHMVKKKLAAPCEDKKCDFDSIYKGMSNKNFSVVCKEEHEEGEAEMQLVWINSIVSVTIISLCSLAGTALFPLTKKSGYNKVLLFMLALSVGSLSGNAIFHMLPTAFSNATEKDALWRSMMIVSAIFLFHLINEFLEKAFKSNHDPIKGASSAGETSEKISESTCSVEEGPCRNSLLNDYNINSLDTMIRECGSECERKKSFFNVKGVKPVAWLITIADFLHNVIDGIAIGTAYNVSSLHGFSTSLAIFCEELPHELGDFSILLNAGFTFKQAAFFNFLSACGAYMGVVMGVLISLNLDYMPWIFAFTAGVFLYISLANMMSETKLHAQKKDLAERPWMCFFIHHLGLICGFGIMFTLGFFEDSISFVQHKD